MNSGVRNSSFISSSHSSFSIQEKNHDRQNLFRASISCGHCVATIERELKDVEGLQSVKANQDTKAVMVEVDSDNVLSQVEAMLVEIGYPPAKA